MNYINKLVKTLKKSPITIDEFNSILGKNDTFFNDVELERQMLLTNGLLVFY